MVEAVTADLRARVKELEAENARLRRGSAMAGHARDAARIVDEITGDDDGTDPFAAAVRATRMPMVISNPRQPDNPIVFVNDAFCRLTGYPREEILGRNCRFLQGADTDPATVARIHAAVQACESVRVDILNYRKTGETFWNRLLMAPVRDVMGDLTYFFASQVDVTLERERLEGLESHNAALMAEVADRLRTEEENAARLRFAAEAGRLGIWDHDTRTGEFNASGRCKEIFGRDRTAAFSSADLLAALHPDDRGAWTAAVERSMAFETGYDLELRLLDRDGATRWVNMRAEVMRAADGTGMRMAGVSLDVTARKVADSHRLALVELGDAIRDIDVPSDLAHAACSILGRTLGVDRAGYGTFDVPADTVVIARDWTRPTVPSLAGTFPLGPHGAELDALKRGEVVAIVDAARDPRTARRAGALAAVGATAVLGLPLVEPSGLAALLYLTDARPRVWSADEVVLVREVADRVQVAIQRRRAEQDLVDLAASLERQVIEGIADRNRLWTLSTDIMLVLRDDGVIAAVNPACIRVLGWAQSDLVGRHLGQLLHPDDAGLATEGTGERDDGTSLQRFETRCRHRDDGYRWISWAAVPGGGFINAVGRDITAEKEQAEALRRAEDHLRQSQKMEAVGQLTGGLAHDFNNLLTGISGSLEMVGTRLRQDRAGEVGRYIDAAQGACKRAAALTHRLLAFSRRQTLDPKSTDVNRLIAGMEELIRRTVGPQVRLDVAAAPDLWTALVDANQLENALLNLAINARDAMPDGGTLEIATSNLVLDEPAARERDLAPGPYLSICVSDTGTGMPPEVVVRAFDPFFTTKPIGQGTGLGLSMIYGFARQSGGQVRIDSDVGAGTRVCIDLPRHEAGDDRGAEPAAPRPDVPRAQHGECVLVVDDEPAVRMLVGDVLADLGYTAMEAEDGISGLRVLESDARVDLLITDVGLPGGMNGRQVADAARTLRPGLKVLFITGYAETAVISDGQLEPGMQILTKPFAIDDLADRIRSLID